MDLPRDKNYSVSLVVGDPDEIRLICGDITQYALGPSSAIVNAANSELSPGGGVCGAIHRAGGPAIEEECRRIRAAHGSFSPGQAVATTAGRLDCKHVIHAVGPFWQGGKHGEPDALSRCYRESMRVADELALTTIAFPAISTGIFGYPVDKAAQVAIPNLVNSLRAAKHLVLVWMVLFDKATLETFATATLAQNRPGSGTSFEVRIGIHV